MFKTAELIAKTLYALTAIAAVVMLAMVCVGAGSLLAGFAVFVIALIPLGLAFSLSTPLFFAAGFIIAALVSLLSALPPAIRSALRRPAPTAR